MSKRTLLLADDSVTIQKVVNLTFADEGIDVVTVGDGDSAMQKISEFAPDVVLADVHMPGLSGYQICEIIRQNPATSRWPVVLLVGSFEPFDESEAARVGANAYLTKPFQSIRQLVTQVTELMQAAVAESEVPQTDNTHSEPGEQPPDKIRDTSDIDSLYHQSFAGPAVPESENRENQSGDTAAADHQEAAYENDTYSESQPHTEVGAAPYVDAGMDDEMIETSHMGGSADRADAPDYDHGPVGYEQPEQPEQSFAPTVEHEYATESSYAAVEEAAEQPGYDDVQETGWQPAADNPESVGAFDSFAEDRSSEAAAEQPAADAGFDEFSRTEQIPASIGETSFNLDELQLLDLPPIEGGRTQEFTTVQRPDAQGGGKEIVNLSPELMEILVQRVVEKLSKDK